MGYSSDPTLYPPEFQELYRKALSETVEITLDYPQQAIQLRHQLHAYRRAIESSKIPGWSDLRQVKIQINKSQLTMSNDSQLRLAMQQAIGTTIAVEPSSKALDDYLKQMEGGESGDD